jgi:hypothetical protein
MFKKHLCKETTSKTRQEEYAAYFFYNANQTHQHIEENPPYSMGTSEKKKQYQTTYHSQTLVPVEFQQTVS